MSTERATQASRNQTVVEDFRSGQRKLLVRLVLLAVLVLVLGQSAVSWFALSGFEQQLSPQLHQKANAVGNSLADQLSYATSELEIPASELAGVDDYFDSVLAANQDIKYLSLIDASGKTLFVRGISIREMDTILEALPLREVDSSQFAESMGENIDGAFTVDGGAMEDAVLHVGVSSENIRSHLNEVFWEVITVVIICWLVTFEFLLFFTVARVEKPIEVILRAMSEGAKGKFSSWLTVRSSDEVGQLTLSFNRILQDMRRRYSDFSFDVQETKNAQIESEIADKITVVEKDINHNYEFEQGSLLRTNSADRIRVPLFLFIFAEELSRSFLPLFVQRYAPTDLMLSSDILIGLPITLFMVAAMIATPIGGGLVDRVGVPRVFLAGIALAIVGFVGNFFTQHYYDLVLYRVLTGVGYGLVFIASEGWVTHRAKRYSRASSTSIFVAAVFGGIICGPPIGGILADRFGFEATFLASALLALISGLILYQVFRDKHAVEEVDEPESTSKQPALGLGVKGWATLLKDIRFVSVLLFAAIPGKMMVAGFIAYLVPLYLNELGHNQPSIGRILMVYGVATLLCLTLASRRADRTEKYGFMVALGASIAGFGCIAAYFSNLFGDPSYAVILAIGSLGVGHALTLPSQNSIIQQVAQGYQTTIGKATVVSAYRLCERLGMVLGPLVAVGLITAFGYQGAIVGFGVILVGLIALFLLTRASKPSQAAEPEVGLANE